MSKMRLSLKIGKARRRKPLSLDDLLPGASGVLARIELPEADPTRLMEIGVLTGARIERARRRPPGLPRRRHGVRPEARHGAAPPRRGRHRRRRVSAQGSPGLPTLPTRPPLPPFTPPSKAPRL